MCTCAQSQDTFGPQGSKYFREISDSGLVYPRTKPRVENQIDVDLVKTYLPCRRRSGKFTPYELGRIKVNVYGSTQYTCSVINKIAMKIGTKYDFIFRRRCVDVVIYREDGKYKSVERYDIMKAPSTQYLVFENLPEVNAAYHYVPIDDNTLRPQTRYGLDYDIYDNQYVGGDKVQLALKNPDMAVAMLEYINRHPSVHVYEEGELRELVRYSVSTNKCVHGKRNVTSVCNCMARINKKSVVREQADNGKMQDGVRAKKRVHYSHTETKAVVFDNIQTDLSEQAIDCPNDQVGQNSSRQTSMIRTPSGMKEVIHMSNDAIGNHKQLDYMPSVKFPETGFVWGANQTFNERTKYYMQPFTYFNTMYLFRIIAKPPLFSAQRVWVSVRYNDTAGQSNLGFEWNPSEENEIHCLVPWISQDLVADVENVDDHMPIIDVTEMTQTIFAEGLPSTIDYAIYVAPINMYLYLPKPVSISGVTPPTTSDKKPLYFSRVIASPDQLSVIQNTGTSQMRVLSVSVTDPATDASIKAITSTAATVDVFDYSANAIGGTRQFYFHNSGQHEYTNYTLLNCNAEIYLQYTDAPDTLTLIDEFNIFSTTYNYPSQNYYIDLLTVYLSDLSDREILLDGDANRANDKIIIKDGVFYNVFPQRRTGSKTVTFVPEVDTYLSSWEVGTARVREQINEYHYNPEFDLDKKLYGKTGDHTKRVDTHWDLITSKYFNTNQDSFLVNTATSGLASLDLSRHFYASKQPIIKFTAAAVPSANVLFRITQVPPSTVNLTIDEILQLPGTEWDPHTGALILQPYWRERQPIQYAEEIDATYLISVLSGTIGSEPVAVSMFTNYTPVEYFVPFIQSNLVRVREQIGEEKPMETKEGATAVSTDESTGISGDIKIEEVPQTSATLYETPSMTRKWNFVTSRKLVVGQEVFTMDIDSRSFGNINHTEIIRYKYWNGRPKFKFTFQCAKNVVQDIHMIQVPSTFDPLIYTATELKSLKACNAISPQDGPLEIEAEWMTLAPRVTLSDSIGKFVWIIENTNRGGPTDAFHPLDVVLNIYCDLSDVQMSIETGYSPSDIPWSPPIFGGSAIKERPKKEAPEELADLFAIFLSAMNMRAATLSVSDEVDDGGISLC